MRKDHAGGFDGVAPWLGLALALLGLATAVYLSVLHWQVHNVPGHVSFCALSEKVNCDTVALSPQSWLLGVPVSTWAALYYLLFACLLAWGWLLRRPPFPRHLLAAMQGPALGLSVYLALVSELEIKALCIMCMTCYGVNLLLALLTSAWARVGDKRTWLVAAGWQLFVALLAAVLFSAAYPEHAGSALLLALQGLLLLAAALLFFLAGRQRLVTWLRHVAGQLAALFRPLWAGALLLLAGGVLSAGAWLSGDLLYKSVERVMAGGTEDISSGHTEHGHPWIGAARPRLVVKEYSDYQCPFCRKAHLAIRQVVRERKDWLRLVHVQVPLDNKCNPMLKRPFHRHACRCALAAICADEQGAFWKMNDLLFAVRCNLDATTPERLAAELGLDGRRFRRCLAGEQARARLSADLAECRSVAQECREAGRKFGTPTFVVGKRVVVGAKPADFWRKLVDELAAER